MGKRSDGQFERRKNDLYKTWDPRAVRALLPHLAPQTRFVEPCAGDGVLIDQLVAAGHEFVWACDLEPGRVDISMADALEVNIERWLKQPVNFDCFITNPPWTREILHPLIVHLSDQAPTWLLFDADWKHTKQSIPYLPRLRRIVSVGRLRWIAGSDHDGKDNCCWYLFDRPRASAPLFFGRGSQLQQPQAVAA